MPPPLQFSGQNNVKFGHFVNFSYIFFGQKCRAPPPLKLTELLHVWHCLSAFSSITQSVCVGRARIVPTLCSSKSTSLRPSRDEATTLLAQRVYTSPVDRREYLGHSRVCLCLVLRLLSVNDL